MKNIMLILIALIAFTAVYGSTSAVSARTQIAGGYAGAAKTDPEVAAAARFAIAAERHKLGKTLSLVSIERAEVQVVNGFNYRLCLKVRVHGKRRTVTTVVYKTLKNKYSLTSWNTAVCKPE